MTCNRSLAKSSGLVTYDAAAPATDELSRVGVEIRCEFVCHHHIRRFVHLP